MRLRKGLFCFEDCWARFALHPKNVKGLENQRQLALALQAWEQALTIDPGLCLAFANKSWALRMVGRRVEALRYARAALSCAPDNLEYQDFVALLEAWLAPRPQ